MQEEHGIEDIMQISGFHRAVSGFLIMSGWSVSCLVISDQFFREKSSIDLVGLPPTWSGAVLLAVATLGYLVSLILVAFPINGPSGRRLRRVAINSPEILRRIHCSTTVRVYCSKSDSYRGFLQPHCSSFKENIFFKVLMRSDGTPDRDRELRQVAKKWREDIGGRLVKIEVRAVSWDLVMFKGWVFDESSAAIGWYNRVDGRTVGQEAPCYIVEDKGCVARMATTFDGLFAKGRVL